MASPRELIESWKKEFEKYTEAQSAGPFNASAEVSDGISKLVRDLEHRRQTGELTSEEKEYLREIDAMLEKIAHAAKAGTQVPTPARTSPTVYNMGTGDMSEDAEEQVPFFIPNISGEQADKIIADLNKQFEEKVLKKLRQKPAILRTEVSDFGPGDAELPSGTNLSEHIKEIAGELPESSFADEDSQKDLSHKVKSHARAE